MIYISGGITGVGEYMAHFDEVERKLKAVDEVINPSKVSCALPVLTHDGYMTVCMALLSLCDTIYMLKGYEQSKGAMQELEYAKEHGYEVVYEE